MSAGARHPATLRFTDRELEAAFEAETGERRWRAMRLGFAVSLAIWATAGAVIWLTDPPHAGTATTTVLTAALPFLVVVLVIARWARGLRARIALAAGANAIAGFFVMLVAHQLELFQPYAAAFLVLTALYSFLFLGLPFLPAAIAAGTYVLAYDVIRATREGPTLALVLDYMFINLATATMGVAAYLIEDAQREAFAQRKTSEGLLLNILPAAIAARLRDDDGTIADAHDHATVLFADLVGFTPLSATLTPRQTVELLDELFRAFDELAVAHRLEKIKTIGDSYMVAGGVPEARDDHARAVAAMGLDMLAAVARISAARGLALDLRVGIHTGPVVAGVIGKRKFSYDLWGDTVNTASRMESHGVPGRVQVSEATRTALGERWSAEDRGEIEVKGKGAMRAWLLTALPSPR